MPSLSRDRAGVSYLPGRDLGAGRGVDTSQLYPCRTGVEGISAIPCDIRSYNVPKVRFYATLGQEEPEVELALV